MKNKTLRIISWVLHGLLAIFLIMDAIGGLTYQEDGIKALTMLHYPVYLMPMMGLAKILAVIALFQPWYKTIREWAYAGLAFNFLGAAFSWAAIGAQAGLILLPLAVFAVMMTAYFLRKKTEAEKAAV